MSESIEVKHVRKVCPHCGDLYTGNSFREQGPDDPPIKHPCDTCIEDMEKKKRGLIVPARRPKPVQVDLLPPQEVGDAYEEPNVLPFRRRT